jgi:hypothetical protein
VHGIWNALSYTVDRARRKVRATVRNQTGALTLEWIIIAAALVAAGAIAASIFNKAIRDAAKSLP